MIEFKFEKVDWEKYEYPGFEIGDIIRELVTKQQSWVRDVATAIDLKLGEEDIPGYYKFICIDNPYGFAGTIWTNPELFELMQKKSTQTLKSKSGTYRTMNWEEFMQQDAARRHAGIPNELDEEEAAELRDAVVNQANAGQVEWHIPAPGIQQVQQVNVNNIRQVNEFERRIAVEPAPWEDALDQPIRLENARQLQVGDVRVSLEGHRWIFEADGRWHIQPRLGEQPNQQVVQEIDLNARAEAIIEERRLHDQEQADRLRRAAEAVNPNRRR